MEDDKTMVEGIEDKDGAEDTGTGVTPPATDWEAKYKEAVAQSRKWEKLARADHKTNETLGNDLDAAKTATEEAVARAEAAERELAEMKAERARAQLVDEIAKETKVPAEILSKMSGDDREAIEANADTLKASLGNSYPKVTDKPAGANPPITKEEIRAITNPHERRKAMAENLDLYN